MALIPLVAVFIVVLPEGVSAPWVGDTAAALGVSSDDVDALTSIESARATFGILGTVLLVFYATSFGTSLQRLYRRAWRRPASAEGNRLKVLEWLVVFVLYSTLVTFLEFAITDAGAEQLARLVELVGGTFVWTWTARILLGSEVKWRALWLGGLLTQLGLSIYSTASLVWVPQALDADEGAFGAYGAALTLLAWLIGCAFVIVVAAALPPVVASTPGPFRTAAEWRWPAGGARQCRTPTPNGIAVDDVVVRRSGRTQVAPRGQLLGYRRWVFPS